MALPDDLVSNPAMLKHLDAQNSPKERRLSSNECSQKWVIELCWGRKICAEKNRVSTQNKCVGTSFEMGVKTSLSGVKCCKTRLFTFQVIEWSTTVWRCHSLPAPRRPSQNSKCLMLYQEWQINLGPLNVLNTLGFFNRTATKRMRLLQGGPQVLSPYDLRCRGRVLPG